MKTKTAAKLPAKKAVKSAPINPANTVKELKEALKLAKKEAEILRKKIVQDKKASEKNEAGKRKILDNSATRMKMILDNTEQAFILIDKSLKIIEMNKVAQRQSKIIFGRNFKLGDDILEYAEPARKTFLRKMYKDLFTGTPKSYSHRFIDRSGKQVFLELNYTPIKDTAGKYTSFILNASDVTREFVAIKEKEEERQNKEALINSAKDTIWSIDHEYCLMAANKAFFKAIKKATGTIPKYGECLIAEDKFPADFLEYWKVLYKRAIEGEQFTEIVYSPKVGKQEANWLEVNFTPIYNEHNLIKGVACCGRDITENRLNMKRLEESEQRFRSLVENNHDMLSLIDADGYVFYFSPSAEKHIGYKIDATRPLHAMDLIHPDDLAKASKKLTKVLSSSKSSVPVIYRCMTGSGNYIWVEGTVSNMLNVPGVNAIVANWRDISEQKKSEEENKLALKISHCFNTQTLLKKSLHQTLKLICDFYNKPFAEVWMKSMDGKELLLMAQYSSSGQIVQRENVVQFKMGEGIPGTSWKSHSTEYIGDLQKNKTFVRKEFAKANYLRSCTAIPLVYRGEVIAVLTFFELIGNKVTEEFVIGDSVLIQLVGEIERKKAEDELSRFFNISPDVLCVAGFDGYFKKVNPAFASLLGYTEEELLGKPLESFVHPEDRTFTHIELEQNKHNIDTVFFENRYITKQGKVIWLEWTAKPQVSEGMIYAVAKDVTDKKKIERERKRILDSIADCFYALDNNFCFTYLNSAAEKFMFVKENELIGENLWERYPALKFSRFHENIVNVINNQEPLHFEFFHEKDNNWFEESIYPTEDGVSVFFRSINDRKQIENALTSTLKEKDSILESFGDGFFAVDSNWIVTYWNNKAQEITGIEREDILHKNFWSVFKDVVSESFFNTCERAMTEKNSMQLQEYLPEVKQWFEFSAYPSEIGLSVYFKNITQRVNSEKRLNELNEELKKRADELTVSNSELERFAYVASHDLQEPLRMVSSFLQLLQKKYKDAIDETGNKYIDFAVNGADRMKRLINDLLQYSRIGKEGAEITAVNMNDVLADVKELFQSDIADKHAQITVHNLPVIRAEKTGITQLMQNLVGNALKYKSSRDPVVTIAAKEQDDDWLFEVADNGIGIDARFYEKIFVIFQRLHNRDEYSGTGIGLAICKKIVEKHKGKIWVESQPGIGSTFYFTISKHL